VCVLWCMRVCYACGYMCGVRGRKNSLRRIYKEGSREPAIPIHYHNCVFSPAMNIHDSVGQTP